ncbi:MAG: glutamine--fructose-6-phosphate transaminase (isomerizing) [Methylacidiphilales bacterium]|nr:glutamine--fructose-6-phosphate transaminase (isomerizing) [Candidatus Methylacidiphilales bacterium]MDW8350199.1 glutamine--fructose-6-phosphate transaminase (isomerizing) [Verrucomicrobiae bacterium]
MCGIVAYLGDKEAQPLLISGLRLLEYRGYDSSGIAILGPQNNLKIVKRKGKIRDLEKYIGDRHFPGHLGISHTRWATHGVPSDINSHPHTDQSGKLALVHNGVIENYATLKERLTKQGHKFKSQTDTEVLAHWIGHIYEQTDPNDPDRLEKAIKKALIEVTGTFGLAVIHADHPNCLIGARRGSPLILGISEEGHFLASDVPAIAAHVQKVVYLNDDDIVRIQDHQFHISSLTRGESKFEISQVEITDAEASKGNFPHYMLKEIFEQPQAIMNAFRGRLHHEAATPKLGGLNLTPQEMRSVRRILFLACGSARHAAMVGESLLETIAHIPAEVDFSSEFRYRNTPLDENTLCFVISQSGETIDSLNAMREAQRKGFRVLGICNRVGSTIARESNGGVYMHSGPEMAVAATKSFTAQVMITLLLAIIFGRMRHISATQGQEMLEAIEKVPQQIAKILEKSEEIKDIAKRYLKSKSMLFLGRQALYPVALEGALKMKEITYIPCEGLPCAELKHGFIALVDKKTPSIILAPTDSLYEKNISSIQEIKARQGPVIAITTEGNKSIRSLVDDVITIPQAPEYITPMLAVVPLQLFAYHTAILTNCDPDKPRNLAKSVTVE